MIFNATKKITVPYMLFGSMILGMWASPGQSATPAACSTSAPNYPWASDDCVMGYTSAPSVNKGGSINFKVSVNPGSQSYTIDIYRMGWYNGAGTSLITSIPARAGSNQTACPTNSTTGLTECNWSNSYTLNVPTTWSSGAYIAQITNQAGWITEVFFVVRDDNRAADFLYQVPVLTYSAYNTFPYGKPNGKSLYDADSSGANTVVGTPRAVKVSLDRPLHHQFGSWLGSSWYEIHLVAWLERMGYNVNYTTDLDISTAGVGYIEKYKALLVGGHSEYWTKAMYDNAEFARGAGTNLAFFGANPNHWQVRLEGSTSGVFNRVLACYKDELTTNFDPITDPTLKTRKWRDLGRPEQTLVGVQHDINGWNTVITNQPPFIVQNSSNWVYNNTNFTDGTTVPYLIGYEVDNLNPNYPGPPLLTPSSQTILGNSPYTNFAGTAYHSQASIYQAPSGAWVFGAGTMAWSWGLGRLPDTTVSPTQVFENAGIQQVTQNILDTYKNAAIEPLETAALTVYKDINNAGVSQSFSFGKYNAAKSQLSIVGDNAISAVVIKSGYTVLLCDKAPPTTGTCITLTASNADLRALSFNDLTSYIEVKPPVNLALGKTATQSSTSLGAAASRAVDGDTNPVYAGNSISYTNSELNAWWQVDLGSQSPIHNILLGNRLDCCSNYLSNFYVFVSSTDLTGRSFANIVADPTVWRYQMQGQVGSSLSIPASVTGRYVRVQLAGQNNLGLREVLVR